ncbi:diacylglycerol kinase family protein [Ornithinimicrobium humiphilum]|uniref:Diacylglycerol kinase family enzyme n=1 Tax=Ornithinimicrobium humiphilum TaxID=125288 RepID=A0A543KJZ6_9MICO|nr:diacylglycerol kinase family protein [Ornithinimicrobium humiphilum]TQM95374.1 diacylglycerol kinase family enzyme [Ornithinimicrobium humiphilum]
MSAAPEQGTRRAAIIVNPTKFDDVDKVRRHVTDLCHRHGWADPLWLETTAEDTGVGQTHEALAAGVDLVCPLGGDGTVRTVGAEMVGSEVPMGLLPGGTGNLLARNLELPFHSLDQCLTIALTGQDLWIDTCRLDLVRPTTAELQARLDDEDDPSENVDLDDAVDDRFSDAARETHTFLVMAGLGFDAEVMAGAPEGLKAKVGWLAYLVAGLRHLKGPQFTVAVKVDGGRTFTRRVRSVMVGNVGKLQGGMELLPDALADDGSVDAVLLSPEGIVGWAATFGQLVTRHRIGHSRVDHLQGREVRVVSDKPVELEIDGDTLGSATAIRVLVQPGSLLVRVPAGRRAEVRRSIDALSDPTEDAGGGAQPHHDDRLVHEG